MKVFSNMRRITKGFSGQEVDLFPNMLDVLNSSHFEIHLLHLPLHLNLHTHGIYNNLKISHSTTYTSTFPYTNLPNHLGSDFILLTTDSPLHAVHSHGSDEGSLKLQELMNLINILSDRVGVLEADLTKTKQTYSFAYTKLILRVKKLEAQIKGRKFSNEGFKDDEGVHGKASTETELFIQEITPIEVIHEQEGKVPPVILLKYSHLVLLGETATYSRSSAEREKVKIRGKGLKTDAMRKTSKGSMARRCRDRLQDNGKKRKQKKAMDEAGVYKTKIGQDDPSVLRYHSLKMKPKSIAQARRNMVKYLKNQGNFKITDFKGMSYNEVRPIFEKLWDFNQKFVPLDAEKAKKKEEIPKEPTTKRKKSIPRKTTRKRQKLEEDVEKDELKGFLDVVPREETPIEIESLSTKFPIVDWKTVVLTETFINGCRTTCSAFLRLRRYSSSAPEGFDLMLWGDLHTLFEPDEEDEIWKDQHEYNLLSWRLCDFCGIHILLMNNGLAIHMLTEKKYP
ncbi:hypothetical protein Tco_0261010 [Tanacetum coccineum]